MVDFPSNIVPFPGKLKQVEHAGHGVPSVAQNVPESLPPSPQPMTLEALMTHLVKASGLPVVASIADLPEHADLLRACGVYPDQLILYDRPHEAPYLTHALDDQERQALSDMFWANPELRMLKESLVEAYDRDADYIRHYAQMKLDPEDVAAAQKNKQSEKALCQFYHESMGMTLHEVTDTMRGVRHTLNRVLAPYLDHPSSGFSK